MTGLRDLRRGGTGLRRRLALRCLTGRGGDLLPLRRVARDRLRRRAGEEALPAGAPLGEGFRLGERLLDGDRRCLSPPALRAAGDLLGEGDDEEGLRRRFGDRDLHGITTPRAMQGESGWTCEQRDPCPYLP